MTYTPATHHQHHFEDLSPTDFERLVYFLVKRSGKFDEVQWYGGARDKGRDVVACKHTPAGREKWYIQCKRYDKITFSTLRDELDKLAQHAKDQPDFAPAVVVFATACPVPPQAKDQAAAHARALGLPEPYYWGRLELDERLKTQPDTQQEFFRTTEVSSQQPTFHTEVERITAPAHFGSGDINVYLGSLREVRSPGESERIASLMDEVERILEIVDHNLQLKLDDTLQRVKRVPVTAFKTAFVSRGRDQDASRELRRAVDDYLDCAGFINSLVDEYEGLISSGSGTWPRQMGVPGTSYSSYIIQRIQEFSRQDLLKILGRLRTRLEEEARRSAD